MQTRRDITQQEMMLLPPLESFIPQDHYLRRLDKILDLNFVHEAVRDHYCQDNGRPSIDPEVVIRLFLIQAMEGIVHVRELMRQVQVNLAYRWFIGYRLDEKLPDHSTLSRALDRFGDGVFNDLFGRSIKACKESGLVGGKVLHIDATKIRADLERDKVGKPGSPDPDARFGRFADGQYRPSYRQQTVADSHSGVIVGLSVSPGNERDDSGMVDVVEEAIDSVGRVPEVVCGDSAYGNGPNARAMYDKGIRLVSPPPAIGYGGRGSYFGMESFGYDVDRDEFTCPSGNRLQYRGRQKGRENRRLYRAKESDCRKCRLKSSCTSGRCRHLNIGEDHAALVKLRADSHTESFKKLYRTRAPVIEGVFAEAKQWHGLRRAWRRGLCKMLIQSLLVATVLNYKRLATLLGPYFAALCFCRSALRAIREFLESISANLVPMEENS